MTEERTTDRGDGQEPAAHETGVPEARRRVTRWPGWVWAIPLAALIFVGWLAAREWLFAPPEVTVHFARAEGVGVGAPVRYKGVQVGRVDEVRLADDLSDVELVLSMEESMDGHLGERTQFWLVLPEVGKGELSNLIAGPYVAVQPGGGEAARRFTGLEEPPILALDQPGRSFILTTDDAGGVSRNAPVLFHGLEVGRVLGMRLREPERRIAMHVFVDEDYADLVRDATVFWQVGGLSVSTGAGGLDVALPSLSTLTSGAIAFETPEFLSGPPAEADAVFALHDSREEAVAAGKGPRVAYFARLPGAVGDLTRGAPVTLGGRQVGRVARVGLEVDAESGELATPVEIELDAPAFDLEIEGIDTQEELRRRLNEKIAALVENGLRARVSSGGFMTGLIGGKSVELVMVTDAKAASLDRSHEPPAIPVAADGGGS